MVLLRPYTDEDNEALLEIEKLCPQGNDKIAETMDKSPDAIARYSLYDNWKVFVAEEENKIVGWIGWTLKQDIDGKKYAYITEVIVHPDFQKKGIGTELIKKVEKDLIYNGASYAYSYVFEANDAASAMFKKNGYTIIEESQTQALFIYKRASVSYDYSIRLVEMDDIPHIVKILNDLYEGWSHFVPFTPESFLLHMKNVPGYGMDKLWVALSGNNIVACAGLWDLAPLARMYYTKEPASMKVLGTLLHFLSHIISVPKFPAENQLFTYHTLVDFAFVPEFSSAMKNLMSYLNNIVLDTESIAILAPISPGDPIVPIIKNLKPSVEKWSVFKKSLDGDDFIHLPLYQDFRDFIL